MEAHHEITAAGITDGISDYPATKVSMKPYYEEKGITMKQEENDLLTIAVCGRPIECEHNWDGPIIEFREGGSSGASSSCSLCGITANEHDLWSAQ